ncbi:hypothetical protein E4U56_005189 [Claviceps arundinis]|uniref:Uncharacterized protein n=1 Tax=Claviceps arundinis TaxID=1623583 RepID=A0A9P7ML74_9HYPO|nr:hypothetical protein E4U56_005189 [Claviceps arundinis]
MSMPLCSYSNWASRLTIPGSVRLPSARFPDIQQPACAKQLASRTHLSTPIDPPRSTSRSSFTSHESQPSQHPLAHDYFVDGELNLVRLGRPSPTTAHTFCGARAGPPLTQPLCPGTGTAVVHDVAGASTKW